MWSEAAIVVFKLVAWWMDKTGTDKEKKKLFYEFIRRAGQDHSLSKLTEYGDQQLKFLEENEFKETQ